MELAEQTQENLKIDLPACWAKHLLPFFQSPCAQSLRDFLKKEISQGKVIYPKKEHIFRAMKVTLFDDVRVVILGQDPYHQPGQAEGLCFSVPDNITRPPSLRNILQELSADLGIEISNKNSLLNWAFQGVLMLNTSLTVRDSQAGSHAGQGWEQLTDLVIQSLSNKKKDVIFVLWGGFARAKKNLIDQSKHHIIESAHPSPLSAYRGFTGSRPFSKINQVLQSFNSSPIDWQL